MTMILFAWKAAVFPAWGSGLLCAAVGIIAGHAVLPLGKVSWRSKALLSVSASIIAGGVMFGFGPLRRSFDLYHADLSNQWLPNDNLSNADLSYANLSGANLSGAYLTGAVLISAHLNRADLSNAKLNGANLLGAKLSYADLSDASLTQANELNEACGNVHTKLPADFTVKQCPAE